MDRWEHDASRQLLFAFYQQLEKPDSPATALDGRTHGAKQRKLAQQKATDVALQLLVEAKTAGIAATHLLLDTWFCSSTSLLTIKAIGYDVIAMTKKSSKI